MTDTLTGPGMERLFSVGAHFAHTKSRRHPSMRPYVIGAKAKVDIFDLAKTNDQIIAAKKAMETLTKEGKTILFVGGKKEISELVKQSAIRIHSPYVATRWLGGSISNFSEIKKRIDRLSSLLEKRDSGELAQKYTKLECVKFDREIERLIKRLDGIVTLEKCPDALVIVDTKHEAHAVREARGAGIPVIGIMSSDCNVADATYPIVANDASRMTVELLLDELVSAFETARAE